MNFPIRLALLDMPKVTRDTVGRHFASTPLAYHNVNHIIYMLTLYDQAFSAHLSVEDDRLMRWAIWYHDVVYDPSARDNEERSAEMAVRHFDGLGDTDKLSALIMSTKKHNPVTDLQRMLVDLDLAILAGLPRDYYEYSSAIRAEYSVYGDDDYCRGRAAALEGLINGPRRFDLLSGYLGYENNEMYDNAIANMAAERAAMLASDPSARSLYMTFRGD